VASLRYTTDRTGKPSPLRSKANARRDHNIIILPTLI
jgi:hypothetical protein